MRGGARASSGATSPESPKRRGHLIVTVAILAVTTLGAILHVAAPAGPGKLAFVVTFVLLSLAIGFGPLARRARPLRAWIAVPLAASSFTAALLCPDSVHVGSVEVNDLLYAAGYACFTAWFIAVTWHVGREVAVRALLDAAAATTAALLAAWTVADWAVDGDLVPGLKWTIFPVLDVLVLALASHLVFRLGGLVRAWWWLYAALVLQLVLDVAYSVRGLTGHVDDMTVLQAGYLVSYAGLALGATHPSVLDLSRARPHTRSRPSGRRRAVFLFVTMLPAVVATTLPVADIADGIVRSGLVAILLLILLSRLLLTMRDLSEANRASSHLASHDDLTGLLNRAALFEALAARLRDGSERGATTALLFLDCDEFKHVNDTWGHQAGDVVLRAVADRLCAAVGHDAVLARHGGDEFVVVRDVVDSADALSLAERVQNVFAAPFSISPRRVHQLTPSIGVALALPHDGQTPVDLLGHADIALYEAKARGRGRSVLFDAALERRSHERARVADALRDAIRDDRFTLDLQPIHGGPGYGELAGWEALARWEDPVMGVVPPDVFVPVAEQLGLIYDLGEVVLRRACREVAALQRLPGSGAAIASVNVSAPQLQHPGFADVVADALREAGLSPHLLWLEITESLLVDEGALVLDVLNAVRATGVRVCIDDFGTGYASLATLLRLPIDVVKIDKSVVARLQEDPSLAQLARLLDLLRSLGVEQVVAEGVETLEQQDALLAMGCPMVQGWLYGRPTPAAQLLAAAREGEAATPDPAR